MFIDYEMISMVIRSVQIYDSGVTSAKIAADTVIPADVDETADFNFSSASGTFAGRLTQLNGARVNDVGTSSTARSFPVAFGAQPILVASYVGATTSSTPLYSQANSASSFTIFGADAGTAEWLALRAL